MELVGSTPFRYHITVFGDSLKEGSMVASVHRNQEESDRHAETDSDLFSVPGGVWADDRIEPACFLFHVDRSPVSVSARVGNAVTHSSGHHEIHGFNSTECEEALQFANMAIHSIRLRVQGGLAPAADYEEALELMVRAWRILLKQHWRVAQPPQIQ